MCVCGSVAAVGRRGRRVGRRMCSDLGDTTYKVCDGGGDGVCGGDVWCACMCVFPLPVHAICTLVCTGKRGVVRRGTSNPSRMRA